MKELDKTQLLGKFKYDIDFDAEYSFYLKIFDDIHRLGLRADKTNCDDDSDGIDESFGNMKDLIFQTEKLLE